MSYITREHVARTLLLGLLTIAILLTPAEQAFLQTNKTRHPQQRVGFIGYSPLCSRSGPLIVLCCAFYGVIPLREA